METPRRIQEQQLANTYMTNLRVTSDVGQTLPNGNYVEAHKPTVIKVHGHQVPLVLEQLRTDEEKNCLKNAEKEFEIRLEAYKEGLDDPKLRERAELSFPQSVPSVAHQMYSSVAIHPLLEVEKEYSCPACKDVYYSANGAGCPKCSNTGELVRLPPPAQIEQYNQTNVLIERIVNEVLPKVTNMFVETIKHSVHTSVEEYMDKETKPDTKLGGKSGKK